MTKHSLFKTLALSSSITLLAACGGGDGSSTPIGPTEESTSVSPSLGLIRNADVRILDLDGVVIDGATGEVGASGTVEISYPAGFSGPVIIEVLGDADAEYFDESTQAFAPFPEGSSLRAILPSPQASVGVTPLTEIAAARFEASGGSSAADVEAANEAVRAQFLPGIEDITAPPTIVGSASDRLGDGSGDVYAAYLATLAELGAGQTSPALAIAQQLAADFSDGNLDGTANGTPVENPVIDVANFQTAIAAAIQRVVTAYSDGSLNIDTLRNSASGGLVTLPPLNGGGATGGGGAVPDGNGTLTAATVNAGLVGTYTMDYNSAPSDFGGDPARSPFTDGDQVSVEITAGGNLIIDGTTYTSPFNRDLGAGPHLPEIIWLDETNNVEFALSDNSSGSFNEINLGDADSPQGPFALPQFLGQLRLEAASEESVAATLGESAGTYNWTATYPGSGYSLEDAFAMTINSDGSVDVTLDGSPVNLNPTDGIYFDSRPNTTVEPGIQIVQDEVTYKITFEDDTPVGFKVGFGLTAVDTSLPSEVTTLMSNLISASPASLRVVQNGSYTDGTIIPNQGNPLCQAVEAEFTDGSSISYESTPFTINDFTLYSRLDWRYNLDAGSGTESLGTNGMQVNRLSDGNIEIAAGFWVTGTTMVNTTTADIATTDASAIATACSDYSPLTVDVSNSNGDGVISGQIEYFDDGTDTVRARIPAFTSASWDAGTTTNYTFYIPNGADYAIDANISGLYETIFCAMTGRFGTGSSSNPSATFDCASTPPSGTYSLSITNDTFVSIDIDGKIIGKAAGTHLFDGLADGADYFITASGCPSVEVEGTIEGDNADEFFSCDPF